MAVQMSVRSFGKQNRNEITNGVASREEVSARLIRAMETGQPQGVPMCFESEEQLSKTLTPKRWEILKK
ncbi:hypothetical protein [Methylococcus mesophilus]|uniref:hypothetical protein n=1 Tax=Methylococcus mesophilus TaxID=2993564 RepID=UPI00224B462B|nr:hypothetical protein [Methylococcus mesophilus]UZR28952.1 hypothetical protein OOT43_19930 [Methylococcus mesophilus]